MQVLKRKDGTKVPPMLEVPQSLDKLLTAWQNRDLDAWRLKSDLFIAYGKTALELGHPSLSFDILKQGLVLFGNHPEMGYRTALALARCGSTQSAQEYLDRVLTQIEASSPLYSDVVSLAGRIAKDRWFRLPSDGRKKEAAKSSADFYTRAFKKSGDYFPGINAATMNMVAGRKSKARAIATQVLNTCGKIAREESDPNYWLLATLGEACVLLGKQKEAADWYARASAAAAHCFGDIASMRRQLNILSTCIEIEKQVFSALATPTVVTFTGNMIDAPDRYPPRFPAEIEKAVFKSITQGLERLNAGFGYCSAACGGDLLFCEAMLARSAEVHIVLPFAKPDFIQTSVAFAGSNWVKRFEDVLNRATSIEYATEEGYLGDDDLFRYAADLIKGMALVHGQQLETKPLLLALMEPEPTALMGGTTDTVKRWRAHGYPAEMIDIAEIRNRNILEASRKVMAEPGSGRQPKMRAKRVARQVKAMLFADVVGFSKLGEEAAPSFFVGFLGEVAHIIARNDPKPLFCNTWGDGLFIVMEDVASAADLALRLRDMVKTTDWAQIGLPKETSIRIGMHAGPVYEAEDPVIKQRNFYGSHVNRAARIEPVTAPGSVYMSEQSASLLATSGSSRFVFDYLGKIELAKRFGSQNLYRLRRIDEIE